MHYNVFITFPGELERLFLVLREKVALERLRSREATTDVPVDNAGPSQGPSVDPPVSPMEVQQEAQGRGHKRTAESDSNSPSKRQAL